MGEPRHELGAIVSPPALTNKIAAGIPGFRGFIQPMAGRANHARSEQGNFRFNLLGGRTIARTSDSECSAWAMIHGIAKPTISGRLPFRYQLPFPEYWPPKLSGCNNLLDG
jgi:hypothetical protein